MPGWVLDLTAPDPIDGEEWDFNKQHIRDKAERMIRDKRALLLIGSESASAHGNRDDKWNNKVKTQENHMQFCAKLYNMQNEQGLYFVHEEKSDNKKDKSEPERRLEEDWRVYKMKGVHMSGEESRTYMTNGRIIAHKISRERKDDLGEQMLYALRDQMKMDGRMIDTGCGCVFAIEEGEREMIFYDDITGEA